MTRYRWGERVCHAGAGPATVIRPGFSERHEASFRVAVWMTSLDRAGHEALGLSIEPSEHSPGIGEDGVRRARAVRSRHRVRFIEP